MLPIKYRLKKKSAYTATYKTGNVYHSKGITLFCGRKKADCTPTKIGFVVSKKVHNRAVIRNHLKRLMRENIRLRLKNKKINNTYISAIFVATSTLINKDYNYINKVINQLADNL